MVERTVEFSVTRFKKGFISADDDFELGWAGVSALGDVISVQGARIGEDYYNVTLKWRVSSQSFEIVNITPE